MCIDHWINSAEVSQRSRRTKPTLLEGVTHRTMSHEHPASCCLDYIISVYFRTKLCVFDIAHFKHEKSDRWNDRLFPFIFSKEDKRDDDMC